MQLETISNATISTLSDFLRIPKVEVDVPFEQQDPQLKLFLFNNTLTKVPGVIFNMDHITVLSLRGNRLTELPPSIFQMKNLEELNVSQNLLKSLPWELLMLISHSRRLRILSLHPNPFYRPQYTGHKDGAVCSPKGLPPNKLWDPMEIRNGQHDMPANKEVYYPFFHARTPVQFSDSRGITYPPFRIDPDATHLPMEYTEPETSLSRDRAQSSSAPIKLKPTKVLSLVELTLQACYRDELAPAEWRGYWDKYWRHSKFAKIGRKLIDLLEEMHMQREAGGQQCTVCRRLIIKPIAQWIEWWEILYSRDVLDPVTFDISLHTQSSLPWGLGPSAPPAHGPISHDPTAELVPFWRRACSWECAMDPVQGLGRKQGETSANSSIGAGPTSSTQP